MHLFKQHAVRDYAEAAAKIPVIDFGPSFAGEPGALARVAAEVRDACEHVGFFYALNHGVPDEIVDRGFAASRRFHALPMDQKLALRLNGNNIGYLPMNASVQGASTVHKATRPNQNESFFVSHDRGPDHPDVRAGIELRGRNQWPDGVPGMRPDDLRNDMMAYCHALGAMCDRMLPAFAVALDLPPDYFARFFANEAHATCRFLHYPPQDADEENLFGQAPHTDNSFMTALARTDVPGLAVRLPTGEWFPPPIIPGTFLINLGNIMRRWSNDRFLSTPHGVINESGTDRYSIAYFHSPNPSSVIECLPSCISADNPPRYEPAVYRDLVLAFYRANYFHQKGHASDAAKLAGAAAPA
ncbi:MAG: isopenicillin N synthase family oxygenase [Alphaproteobacteria bacterium]|nr:isopenicillin N synthase family oxygenase [Alphaproteobacteria bacterium]